MASRIFARIGVVGGGTMGAGIAHAALTGGSWALVVERDDEAAAAAAERVRRTLHGTHSRGRLPQPVDEYLARLTVTTSFTELSVCEVVVEAVPERPELKLTVLSRICDAVDADAVIGTNTSSLSIDHLAQSVRMPGRFIGLHFFNPVPASTLVEVVRGSATEQRTVTDAHALGRQMGKTTIEVNDFPGFATSRLGVALGLEAMRMLADGVADAESIDTAMRLGYKHPIGPLRLTDLVGLDVRLAVADYLESQLGPRFRAPDLLREKVARGELGQKSGRGFYDWPEAGTQT